MGCALVSALRCACSPRERHSNIIYTYNAHISDAAAPASLLLLISQFVPPSSAIPIRDARAIPPAPSFPPHISCKTLHPTPLFATPRYPNYPTSSCDPSNPPRSLFQVLEELERSYFKFCKLWLCRGPRVQRMAQR